MTFSLFELLLWILPLILVEGLFSGAEIALFSADRYQLKKKSKAGSWGASLAVKLIDRPEMIFSTTLIITNGCIVLISALLSVYLAQFEIGTSEAFVIAVTSFIIVIFGELIPKTLYQKFSNSVAEYVAIPVYCCYFVNYPISRLISVYTSRLSKLSGPIQQLVTGKKHTSREELKTLLNFNKKDSELRSSERRMIRRIFEFSETDAKHALIPLVRVDAIENTSTIREALTEFSKHRHSRMPVYENRIDNIIGVIEISDLLVQKSLELPIAPYMQIIPYVPETQAVEDVLREMHEHHHKMTVVVDEYGGAVGILTFEDIVEEVVGEITDEHNSEQSKLRPLDSNRWLAPGILEVSKINEQLKIELPEGSYETLAGFLLEQFGHIPSTREEIIYKTSAGEFRFTIRQANARAILSIEIERLLSSE